MVETPFLAIRGTLKEAQKQTIIQLMTHFRYVRATLLVVAALACGPALAGKTVVTENPTTKLKSWKQIENGISVELIQLLPDFVQATFAARDLPASIFESMRGYCVFGTVVRNESEAEVSYRVADWRYRTRDGKSHTLRTKTEWIATWKKSGADFGFAILPDDITFDAGDWAQGFTTPRIPPGTQFDLIFTWNMHGKKHTGTLRNVVCPNPQR